jgi:hypothetical protein
VRPTEFPATNIASEVLALCALSKRSRGGRRRHFRAAMAPPGGACGLLTGGKQGQLGVYDRVSLRKRLEFQDLDRKNAGSVTPKLG